MIVYSMAHHKVEKRYLGDGVYIDYSPMSGMLVLTTENGYEVTNTIFLESEVYEELLRYVKDLNSNEKSD